MKISALLRTFALALTVFAVSPGCAQKNDTGNFYLKNGDRVVFYGDSITEQCLYNTFTETYVVTRFPNLDVTFTHSGVGGDRVTGGWAGDITKRLDRDLFPYHPNVVTIMLGMNDGSYRAFDQKIFDTYKNGLISIVDKLEKNIPGVRLTLIQPSPYDDVTRAPGFEGGYNAVLVKYGETVREIATAHKQNTADFNTGVVNVLEKAKDTDAKTAEKIIPDRIHPHDSGQLIMAGELLKSWSAPAEVSTVKIDAVRREAKTSRATVSALKMTPELITWKQVDASLPMPVNFSNREIALAVNSSDFIEKLNQQILQVTGLKSDIYQLLIDDETVGVISSKDLERGVNLALLNTPMLRQANQVHDLTLRRTKTHTFRWRDIQLPLENATGAMKDAVNKSIKEFDDADEALRQAQHLAAQPVPHNFALRAIDGRIAGVAGDPLPNLGKNLAINKKWNSTNPNRSGWDAGLTDGVWTGRDPTVYATDDNGTFPKKVTIDLEKVMTLRHVLVGIPDYGSTKTISVSLSKDGERFEQVGFYEFSVRKEEKRLFNFDATQARYIRLTYIGNHSEENGFPRNYAFTTDVQAFE